MSKSVTHFNNSEEIDECKHEGISEAYLHFIHNVMPDFQVAILTLVSDNCTVLDIDRVMMKLMSNLKNRFFATTHNISGRKKNNFFGSKKNLY